MAKTRDIRTRVAFEGETEYKKVVSDIAAEHKKLNNELKAAQAEFKATGNAEKMFEEKSKLLNKQIEAQNKAIKTAEDALKKLKDNGVEKSSAAWVYWEKELTNAKTAMFNATAELNKLNSEFGNVTQATERATQETADYSETLKSIDKGVKFPNVLKGLGLIKDAVGGVISTAYRMGKALVMSQLSGGDWAREIMMGAARAGVSVEEYQAQLYAQAVSGIETDAITEGVKKTAENLATTDAELLKLYNDLGISTRNADGSVRNMTETFWASVDALKGIEDQTTRSILAQKLLGDEYMNLRGLVDLGSEGYEKLIEEGKQSAVVTEDSVNALADMDAAVEKVNATAEATKHNIEAQLAPGFTELAEALGTIMTEFNDFVQSDQGKAAFEKVNQSIKDVADTIRETDLEGAFEGVAKVLNGIVKTFEAIVNMALKVKEIVETLILLTDPQRGIENWEKSKDKTLFGMLNGGTSLPGFEDLQKEPVSTPTATQAFPFGRAAAFSGTQSGETLIKLLEEMHTRSDFSKIASDLSGYMQNPMYQSFFASSEMQAYANAIINDITQNGTPNTWELSSNIFNMQKIIEAMIGEMEAGGGGAMNAFNAAIEKGTQDTQKTLKTGVAAAFSGFDSLFASMGAAHGASYINALAAQMARINSMLSLAPSYYASGAYASAQSAYASPTSATNFKASIYVGKERFGEIATPIVNADMGADLVTLR